MSIFKSLREHADNPPKSWVVKGAGDSWTIETKGGRVLLRGTTESDMESLKTEGVLVNAYELHYRWFAGRRVAGWPRYDPFDELVYEDQIRESLSKVDSSR